MDSSTSPQTTIEDGACPERQACGTQRNACAAAISLLSAGIFDVPQLVDVEARSFFAQRQSCCHRIDGAVFLIIAK